MVLKSQEFLIGKIFHDEDGRIILPDTKYNDLSVAKFINYIMNSGKGRR